MTRHNDCTPFSLRCNVAVDAMDVSTDVSLPCAPMDACSGALRSRSSRWRRVPALVALTAATLLVSAHAAEDLAPTAASVYRMRFERTPTSTQLTALGRAMFVDPALSASGKMSCASCHDPAHAYGPPNERAVQVGGATMREPGVRAVPSLRYLQSVPRFTEHFVENEGGRDGEDQGPAGGNTWDGRARTVHEQAILPLLSPFEMANRDQRAVVARLARSSYASDLRAAFGPHVLDDPERGFAAAVLALEVFQQSPRDFYPYTSRYDDVLRGRATLTPAEARGLALFEEPTKGNCASCHPSQASEGALPAFTDFGYNAIGVPRNAAIPANRDPAYRDLGLCGPYRTDLANRSEYCGLFRAPSLRNVAVRHVFFHNGAIRTLSDAVRFYAERDVRPERWYPRNHGRVALFDDLPPRAVGNVNREPPFGGNRGDRPVLSDGDIADVVAFLKTLTDRDVAVTTPSLRSSGLTPPARAPR
jgi:cytochrome c peroxidase